MSLILYETKCFRHSFALELGPTQTIVKQVVLKKSRVICLRSVYTGCPSVAGEFEVIDLVGRIRVEPTAR